jgi:hypothetical protein
MAQEQIKVQDLLGTERRDWVTGLAGVVTSVCFYLKDQPRVYLQPRVNEKGEFTDGKWFTFHRTEPL